MTPEQGNDADLRTELAQLIEQHQADPQKLQALLQHLAEQRPDVAQLLSQFAQEAGGQPVAPPPEQPTAMQYEADMNASPHDQIQQHVRAAMADQPPPGHDEWRAQLEHHLRTDPSGQAAARMTQEANYDNEPGTAVAPANQDWWGRNKDTVLGVGLPLAATVGGALLHHKLTTPKAGAVGKAVAPPAAGAAEHAVAPQPHFGSDQGVPTGATSQLRFDQPDNPKWTGPTSNPAPQPVMRHPDSPKIPVVQPATPADLKNAGGGIPTVPANIDRVLKSPPPAGGPKTPMVEPGLMASPTSAYKPPGWAQAGLAGPPALPKKASPSGADYLLNKLAGSQGFQADIEYGPLD